MKAWINSAQRQTQRLSRPPEFGRRLIGATLLAGWTLSLTLLAVEPVLADEDGSDPVTLSFAFVGCNRVGWGAKDGHALPPSTANTPQLMQTFEDIASMGKKSGHDVDYFFILGDLVRNEASGKTLKQQLSLWQGLWESSALAGSSTQMVPLTGNHEVMKSVEYAKDEYYEVPDASSNIAWLQWLNAEKHPPQPGNGPTVAGDPADLLRGDNSQMTYSFNSKTADGKSVHFLLMDTDTDSSFSTQDTSCYQPPLKQVSYEGHPIPGTMSLDVPGWIPIEWVKKDMAAAAQSDYIFALGHKPIVFPSSASAGSTSTGRDTIFNCGEHMQAQELVSQFSAADNFVAYLTAHQHLWDAFQIQGPARSFWQVVAGDGGSPLVSGNSFGFTFVELHASGNVTATRFDRPVPSDYYYSPIGVGPAQATKTFSLSP